MDNRWRHVGWATLVTVASTAAATAAEVRFTPFVIDDSSHGNASLVAADLDGDGRLEIVAAVIEDNAVVSWSWDRRDPTRWTRRVIDDSFVAARSVAVGDLDGDGAPDILGASYDGGEVAWWRNLGGSPPAWGRHAIDDAYSFPHEVHAADVDGDGRLDVLAASSTLNRITLWRNQGGDPPAWREETIATGVGMAKSVTAGDLDGDGRTDVVGAALEDNAVLWWRNLGGEPIAWEPFVVDAAFGGAHRVEAVDLDGDGDLDLVGAGYTGHVVAWWRNLGGAPLTWQRQTLSSRVPHACVATAADLDGDAVLDVVASAQLTGEVTWWRNDGAPEPGWSASRLGVLERVWPIVAADLDGDGDTDVVAGSSHRGSNQVVWFRNERIGDRVRTGAGRVAP